MTPPDGKPRDPATGEAGAGAVPAVGPGSIVAPVRSSASDTPPVGPRREPRFGSRMRRAAWVAGLVAVVLVGYYLVSLLQVVLTGRSDEARPVDAIVVLGAAQYDGRPSPQLAARLDHARDLWGSGLADTVVVTGGKLPGDRFTEAEASAGYLTERGVPVDAILLENEGHTTYESLAATAELLAAGGRDEVLLVTDPYHALRSRLIAEEVGLVAHVSATPTSVVTGWASARRHVTEAAGVALGRVIGFERLSGLAG